MNINANEHCLINNIYTPKKVIIIYIYIYIYIYLHTKFMVKKFKHRFYIK